jgi:hypothetical protein
VESNPNQNNSKVELFFNFLNKYGQNTFQLVIIGILCYLISLYQSQNDGKIQQVLTEVAARETVINELKKERQTWVDSTEIYRKQLNSVIKIIAATELTIKQKPDEDKILKKYNALSDSLSYVVFMQRYGKEFLPH